MPESNDLADYMDGGRLDPRAPDIDANERQKRRSDRDELEANQQRDQQNENPAGAAVPGSVTQPAPGSTTDTRRTGRDAE